MTGHAASETRHDTSTRTTDDVFFSRGRGSAGQLPEELRGRLELVHAGVDARNMRVAWVVAACGLANNNHFCLPNIEFLSFRAGVQKILGKCAERLIKMWKDTWN